MANHSKNKNLKDQSFKVLGEGKLHRPKKVHEHIAREVHEAHGPIEAGEFLRRLTPAARERVMGQKPGTERHPGWFPQGGRRLTRMEENIRGGMIG